MAIAPSFHRHPLFSSFFLTLDLKLGCTILTLFNLFNKSAGIFGLLAIFQGGTLAQLSLYAYSLGTIFLSLWGLRGISEESCPTVLLYAHMYLADHLISSLWSFYFFNLVYYANEHNGQPPSLSPYQQGLMALIESIEDQYVGAGSEGMKSAHHTPLVGQERVDAAQRVWKAESSFSASVLIAGWALKIYFALLLYSYALHLRHGTYRSLPLSKPAHHTTADMRNGYIPIRPSISIDREAPQPRTIEDELPGWSDDEEGEADDGMGVESKNNNSNNNNNHNAKAREALDRLSST